MHREEMERLTDAIEHHARAMDKIADSFKELVTCMCSVDALGRTATTPTININQINKED